MPPTSSQPSEIVRVAEDAIARLGNVDILVNNAARPGAPLPRTIRSRRGTR
jgi:NAD(P)-dependent dehydrogenase (short-subunit alcohol dehydrogenase family)